MNKKIIPALILGSALTGVTLNVAAEDDMNALKAEGKTIIKGFFEQLKGTLGKAMKEGGPVNAIEACNLEAPKIAAASSETSGWNVARTSLKLRNPGNAPDEWELKVLNQFEERKAKGENPMDIAYAEVVENDGKRQFRMMKAIPTAKLCLNCHGSELNADVVAKLDSYYPTDAARGFSEGDIRGAFTLTKDL